MSSASFLKFYCVNLQNAFLRLLVGWFWSQIMLFLQMYSLSLTAMLVVFSYHRQSDEQNRADKNNWSFFSHTTAFSCGFCLDMWALSPRCYMLDLNMNWHLLVPSIRGVIMSVENGEISKVQSSNAKGFAPQFEIPMSYTKTFHPPSIWLQERKTYRISG